MTSDKQAASNGRNARKATGPRTPDGKQRVAKNAVTHGLTASDHSFRDENPDEFDALLRRLTDDWKPKGETMRRLVKGLAIASCRVDRAVRAESAALEATLREAVEDPRDVQRRNEDTLRRDLLELKRSTDGFTQAAREDRSGLSAPQLQRAHRQETLLRVRRNPSGLAHLLVTVDRSVQEIISTQAITKDTVVKIALLFANEEPTLLQRMIRAMSADAALGRNDVSSLSQEDVTTALTVLRTEYEDLTTEIQAMETRVTEERALARDAIHLASEERLLHIQRYETSATREFYRLIEQLLRLQKERSTTE